MAYKTGNRYQISFLPDRIDNYVGEEDPVRIYDMFVENLNIEELGIKLEETKLGRSSYEPKSMLKLLVYGYSYGWRSSRKLERAVHHNLSFIWLMGGLKPDHKTISRFRKDNKEVLKKVLKQCVRICMELNLIEGNTLFLDGSKIRGNASINQTRTKEGMKNTIEKIEKRIEEILEECNKIDKKEKESLVKISKELKDKKNLKEKMEKAIKKIEEEEKEKINLTDKECVIIKGRQGTHAGYNAQMVVDEKNGLIVNVDVVSESNDMNQFSKQIKNANEVLAKKCQTACADAGYSKADNLKEIVEEGIEVIVPSQRQALHNAKEDNKFRKDKFKYDKEKNCYICPKGKELKYDSFDKSKNSYKYIIKERKNCLECNYYGECTKGKKGRTINRLKEEETKEMLEKIYESKEGQEVYEKRKSKVELPFGHIKRNLNGGAFLLRGIEGANAEMSINSICFNLVRMKTLLGGVCKFISELSKIKRNTIKIC